MKNMCAYKHIYSTERKRGRERQRIYRSLQRNDTSKMEADMKTRARGQHLKIYFR